MLAATATFMAQRKPFGCDVEPRDMLLLRRLMQHLRRSGYRVRRTHDRDEPVTSCDFRLLHRQASAVFLSHLFPADHP